LTIVLKAIIPICLALPPAAAVAQTAADKLAFEVASVKPAPAPTGPGMVMSRMRGGPGTTDPGRITYSNVTERMLLAKAYGVQDYQISGPAWIDSERYEIVAKVPKGATEDQFKVMLQNLLAERFQLTLHHETRKLPLYALVVAKNGPKLKEAAAAAPDADTGARDGANAAGGPPPPPPPPDAGFGPPGGGSMARPPMGLPRMPPGMGRGAIIMMMMPGRARMIGNAAPTSKLAEALARQLGSPVTDQTGLKANYDFTLEFDPEGSMGGRSMMRMPGPPPGGPSGGGGGEGPGANPPESDAASLFTALQEQLGLKLEQKKGPLDVLVIDHTEKTPVEN
jgi:uncharacterized protein (TIGR03435 family)